MLKESELAEYFVQLGHCQRRLTYCRQILAANESFSPLDIYQEIDQSAQNYFREAEFSFYLQTKGFFNNDQDCLILFQYFDLKNDQRVTPKGFTDLFKLNENSSHSTDESKVCIERSYALKRFYIQALQNTKVLSSIRCSFHFIEQNEEGYDFTEISIEQLQKFMKKHSKFPERRELELILRGIYNSRNKISLSTIKNLIGQLQPIVGPKLQVKESYTTLQRQEDSKHKKLITFSSMRQEEEVSWQNTERSSRIIEKETPYKLLSPQNIKTPAQKEQIYKPTKLVKKPVGKENRVGRQGESTPVKRQMLSINTVVDSTRQKQSKLL